MATENTFADTVIVYLGSLGERQFADAVSLSEWAEGEQSFWRSINERIERHSPFSSQLSITDIVDTASELKSAAASYAAATSDGDRGSIRDEIERLIARYGPKVEIPSIASESMEGQLIEQLADQNPWAAWIVILRARGGIKNVGQQRGQALTFSDINEATRFLEAWEAARPIAQDAEAALNAQKTALANLRTRWERRFASAEKAAKRSDESFARRRRQLRRIVFRLLRDYRGLHSEHAERMEEMRQAFSTEMRLRAAEKFWGSKRRVNRKRAEAALKRLYLIGGVGAPLLIAIFFGLFYLFGLPEGFSVTHALIYSVPLLVFVWLLRIHATEYRSNKDMADDAEEREAMVMTFKALEYEDKRVGPEERLVILNALFRPSGRSAEDGVPSPVWEAIAGQFPRSN